MKKSVEFVDRDGRKLAMDLKLLGKPGDAKPMVMCIHGGGWAQGDRKDFHAMMEKLASWGYSSATVSYRLTDVAPWPAQLEDVQAGLEWIVEHADEYGIDAERIAVTGGSAGGHLALMLGLMPEEKGEGRRVRAVVNLFGPTDFKPETVGTARRLVEDLIDGKLEEEPEKMKAVSPITYIDRTDAPVLTFHGTEDRLVNYKLHAPVLHKLLDRAQVPNELVPMEGIAHGFDRSEASFTRMKNFLDAYLKGGDHGLIASEDFEGDQKKWELTDGDAWQLKRDGRSYYALTKKKSDYQPEVRSPHNIAWLKGSEVGDFMFDVDLRSTEAPYGHQSLCLFFGHQDASHFYYVHFGRKADKHANSIFKVDGAPRVSIAKQRTEGTDWSSGWHRARIVRDTLSGKIEVFFDDMEKPVMSTVDKTFPQGSIGIGSFDDTGDFDAVRLWGKQ
ncbi:MAG: acetyl esterase/lipase [Verrucomicrobiales bacterium]|jgi:acetyl esterase/lipase